MFYSLHILRVICLILRTITLNLLVLLVQAELFGEQGSDTGGMM